MDRPPVFSDQAFSSALDISRSSSRLLIVDATAEWCGPCKQMDRTTWRDPGVVAWFEANALALQIDVDRDQDWAKAYQVRAMPTLIAFQSGAEIDRIVGLKKPRELLDWLKGLQEGKTSIEQLKRKVEEDPTGDEGRFDLARALVAASRLDEATEEYAWLWENLGGANTQLAGLRLSLIAYEIGELVGKSDPARARFHAIRERAAANAGTADLARLDWIVLNETLAEPEATVSWFDKVARQKSGPLDMPELAHRLVPLLLTRGRWADASRLINNAIEELERLHTHFTEGQLSPDMDEEFKEYVAQMALESFRRNAAQMHQMLLAGGRADEAEAVAQKAMSLHPSDEMKEWLAKPREDLLKR
jgi:thiol-disulfide isomerase/thioredoxin